MHLALVIYREVLTFVDRFTALRFTATGAPTAYTNFDDESICLFADNVRNELVTVHRTQEMLKILPIYT
jgi:hypothetical protein